MNVFIGIITEVITGKVLFEHITTSEDNPISLSIWKDSDDVPTLQGTFDNWKKLGSFIKREVPELNIKSYNAGEISAEWLINVLKR